MQATGRAYSPPHASRPSQPNLDGAGLWEQYDHATGMRNQIGALVLVGIGVTACTSVEIFRPVPAQSMAPPSEAFAHRLATPDVELYWNCARPEPSVLRFDGIAKNIGRREVRSLELRLAGVAANDLLQEGMSLPDIVLYRDEFSPFHMQLPIRGTETRFDLLYQYPLALPVDQANPPSTTPLRFTAQDVCSETQYRAR